MGGMPFLVAGKFIVFLGCGDISPHAFNPLNICFIHKKLRMACLLLSGGSLGIPWNVLTDDLCYPSHQTPFQSHFDPVRVGERAGKDLVYDTPCLFVAALILFPDNIYGKPNPD